MTFEACLLEIITNASEPVLITTPAMQEIADAVLEVTKVRIYFKQFEKVYFNEAGYQRIRKEKNTFDVWVMKDMIDLQEADLEKLRQLKNLFG